MLSPVSTIIQFDGEANLSQLRVGDSPYILAYLPDTVNSQMLIGIPSDTPVNVEGKIQYTPDSSELNSLAQMAKTDLLLTSDGDLAITQGDILTASGLTNLTQAALLKIYTKLGDLLQHPTYGNPLDAGINLADTSASDILKALSSNFATDPRFVGVVAGRAVIQPPAAVVQLLVGVSGSSVNLPITAAMPIS